MNDMATSAARLRFATDAHVTGPDRGGLYTIRRYVAGKDRSVVLAPQEALLCAVLERGEDLSEWLGKSARNDPGVQDRLARLPTALRAYLSQTATGSSAQHSIFPEPQSCLSACRQAPDTSQYLLRDISPQEVVWYVTHRCPRQCRYCHWVEKGRSDLEHDILPAEQTKGLVQEAWLGGVERLVMTGGEPMLRRDLMEIIGHGRDLGLPIWLFTRYHFTPQRAADLAAAGVARVFYSLDTLDPIANRDLVENAAVVGEARRSLEALANAGIDVTVVPVLTALNTQKLPDLAQDMAEIGVRAIRPIAYKGRKGAAFNDVFTLSVEDKDQIRRSLDKVSAWVALDLTTLDLETKTGICESGITTIYVQPDGAVSYCPLTRGVEGAPFGRLPQDSLDALWQNRRLGRLLAGNALAPVGARHLAKTTDASSCVLRDVRLDLT